MAKSIFITGASSGIGRATAERFLDEGWQVGLFARRAEQLEEVAAGRSNATVYAGDVTIESDLTTAIDGFQDTAGGIDVLFNNAGIFAPAGLIDEIPITDWHNVVDVNLTGMFLAARAAFSAMRRQDPQGGRIINNGSISAYVPRANAITYTVTKHAITGLTRQLSLDGRPFDIACGQIDIGNARTPMIQGFIDKALAENPDANIEPTMDVADVAASVLHMASLPLGANVQFMTVMATKMSYIGRG